MGGKSKAALLTNKEYRKAASDWRVSSLKGLARFLAIPYASMHDELQRRGVLEDIKERIRESLEDTHTDDTSTDDSNTHVSDDEEASEETHEENLVDPDYEYDEIGGYYIFRLNGKRRVIPEDLMKKACRMYPEKGEGFTLNEVAEEINIPRPDLEVIFRKYQFFKSSQPFTHEEFMEMEDDEADRRTLEIMRHRWRSRLARKERADVVRRLEEAEIKLNRREWLSEQMAEAAVEVARALPHGTPTLKEPVHAHFNTPGLGKAPWASFHAPVADLHIGKQVYGKEMWGENYDTDIACERLEHHAIEVAKIIANSGYRCHTLYTTDVGDFFHALLWQTEHGTYLHQDSRPKRVAKHAFDASVRHLETLRPFTEKIVRRFAEGNHGYFHEWEFNQHLATYYRQDDKLDFDTGFEVQGYFEEGEVAHVLDHGYKLKDVDSRSTKDMVAEAVHNILPVEVQQRVRYVVYYIGHLHERSIGEASGRMEIIRLPSFGETDDHSAMLYFSESPRGFVYRLNEAGYIKGEERIYFHQLARSA